MKNIEAPPLIAHVIYEFGTGGLENGLVHIINGIPESRYRHAVVCLTSASEFASRINRDDVEIIQLDKKPGHDVSVFWRYWKTMRRIRPAIVHSRNLAALETQFISLLCPGNCRVHGEHGRDISDIDGTNIKYRLLRKLSRLVIHHYIAVSRDLSEWLLNVISVSPGKLTQIYNGVDQQRFFPEEKLTGQESGHELRGERALVIGTVGRLAAVKNQASLLRAFKLLTERMSGYSDKLRLLIVGDGALRSGLEQIARENNVLHLVEFAGDRSDIPEQLRKMDIFVLPSLGEGISNTVLEAMATGLPIIATNIGGNPELVEHDSNGFLVPVDDDESLSEAMARLAEDPDLRRKMGAMSQAKVRAQFSWDKTVTGYLSIYDQLLGRRAATGVL